MLWCAAIRGAVVHGTAQGPAAGLDLIPVGRREGWARHLGDAWSQPPSSFNPNGFCVTALQAAWSAVAHTPAHPGQIACRHLEDALAAAIRIGDDSADAVVSLCQVGWADFPAVPPRDHLQIWLAEHPGDNNNPHYAVDQAARAVAALRGEGKRVFLHSRTGQSRAPATSLLRYSRHSRHRSRSTPRYGRRRSPGPFVPPTRCREW